MSTYNSGYNSTGGAYTTHRREKEAARLMDHVQTDLKLEGIKLTILSANPITKEFIVKGEYADLLLARKFGAKKDYTFTASY